MRYYETIYILHPQTEEAEINRLQEMFLAAVARNGAEVYTEKRWGLRTLAHEVEKQTQGYYIMLRIKGLSAAVTELERLFKISDPVIKFQTIRLDEKNLPTDDGPELSAPPPAVRDLDEEEAGPGKPQPEDAAEEEPVPGPGLPVVEDEEDEDA